MNSSLLLRAWYTKAANSRMPAVRLTLVAIHQDHCINQVAGVGNVWHAMGLQGRM